LALFRLFPRVAAGYQSRRKGGVMSNTDSFINEVTEEVRRDKMYGLLRRWGWLAVLLVVLIVGGAAWSEWTRARGEARAQAFGDAVLAALSEPDQSARRAALGETEPALPGQDAVLSLLLAAAAGAPDAEGGEGDPAAGRDALLALAEDADLAVRYRHLALSKVMLAGGTGDATRDGAILEELATPGAPYRTLAVEQQALRALEAGDEATAVTLLRALQEDAEASQALRRRALQLMFALGAAPEPA